MFWQLTPFTSVKGSPFKIYCLDNLMLTPLWPYFREYWNTKTAGTYMCVCCSTPLFRSKSSLPELMPVSIFILLCFRCLFFLRVIDLCPYHLAATPYRSPLHYCLIYCALICHHLHLIVTVFLLSFPISPLWPYSLSMFCLVDAVTCG
jgi:hypothetical protein